MSDSEGTFFQIQKISKLYGSNRILRELDLTVEQGEFVLLLGSNGAGKSTLLRICAGLSRPDTGAILFKGHPVGNDSWSAIAHVGHELFLYGHLNVHENLQLFSGLHNLDTDLTAYEKSWLLTEHSRKPVNQLSRGLQFRTSLARAFLPRPELLLLDEATSAFDQRSFELFIEHVQNLKSESKKGCTILIASHDVERLKRHVDRIVVLDKGVISLDSREIQTHDPVKSPEQVAQKLIRYYAEVNR